MFKKLLLGLGVATISLFGAVDAAHADSCHYGSEYGYGSNYFEIHNESDITVAFDTDETSFTHSLAPGECLTIWTDYSWIEVDYDESDAPGWQNYNVQLNYPDDLSFYTWDEGYYTVIDHYTW